MSTSEKELLSVCKDMLDVLRTGNDLSIQMIERLDRAVMRAEGKTVHPDPSL